MLSYLIQNIFKKIAASVADAAAVIPNGIKTNLANGLSTYFTKSKPVFSNGPKHLKILPIVLFYAITFLIILYYLSNHLQKL